MPVGLPKLAALVDSRHEIPMGFAAAEAVRVANSEQSATSTRRRNMIRAPQHQKPGRCVVHVTGLVLGKSGSLELLYGAGSETRSLGWMACSRGGNYVSEL